MSDDKWIPCSLKLPPDGEIVMTKIHDSKGSRNEQPLRRQGRLWWMPDDCDNPGHAMYVYYTPTHWRGQR